MQMHKCCNCWSTNTGQRGLQTDGKNPHYKEMYFVVLKQTLSVDIFHGKCGDFSVKRLTHCMFHLIYQTQIYVSIAGRR